MTAAVEHELPMILAEVEVVHVVRVSPASLGSSSPARSSLTSA